MHLGWRATLETWLRCDFADDMTNCGTDLLCGRNTQLMLLLSL